MKETTVKPETAQFVAEAQQLREFWESAVGHFRVGEDPDGMESFLGAMEKLELTVETDLFSQQPQIDLHRLLPALEKVVFFMRNRDIPGLVDLLEDTLIPLTDEWRKKGHEA